ncbi:MAG: DUF6089 family protein [Candidatus Cyclobacteriaceae bacterium M2_1C_046]
MKRKNFLIFTILLLFFTVDFSYGQINRRKIRKNNKRISNFRGQKSWFGKDKVYNYIGVSVNSLNYFGDLAPLSSRVSTDLSFTRPGIGLFFAHRFGPRYTFRVKFNYGTLRGDDFESADLNDENARFRYVRNLHFRNRIKELTLTGIFDLFKNEASYISRVQFTPYAFVGISVFHHNPQALVNPNSSLPEAGQWVDLQPLGTEGQYANLDLDDVNYGIDPYSKIQLAIPMGLGIRYRINQVVDLSFETGFRYLFTDYIDDVSANYVNLDRLDDPLAIELSDRSREQTAAVSGADRTLNNPNIAEIVNRRMDGTNGRPVMIDPVTGEYLIAGFGFESRDNMRGNVGDRDIFMVTSIKVSFILGASFRRAKFR